MHRESRSDGGETGPGRKAHRAKTVQGCGHRAAAAGKRGVSGDGSGSGVFRGKSCGACRDSAAVRPASGILYRARGEAACECTGGQPGQEERRLKQAGRTGVEEEERGSISGARAFRHPAADGKESMRLRGQPGRQSGRANGETGQTGQPGGNRTDGTTGEKPGGQGNRQERKPGKDRKRGRAWNSK